MLMSKDKIILNSVNPIHIYGEKNDKINLIKSYFPDLKIIARGLEIILEGENKKREDWVTENKETNNVVVADLNMI